MCPCTVSHDPGERPPGARRSTRTSSPAPPDRSRYASMKETCTKVTNQRRRPSTASNRAERARARKDRKSTRLNSSHGYISYAVFCLKKKKNKTPPNTHTDLCPYT